MLRHKRETGDTIIEVLLAVAVFSLVAVGGLTVMNQSVNTAQRAIELTLVRQQIDAQAEALRAVHEAASKSGIEGTQWQAVTSNAGSAGTYAPQNCPDNSTGGNTARQTPQRAFAMNPLAATKMTNTDWYSGAGSVAEQPPYAQTGSLVAEDDDESEEAPEGNTTGKSYGIWIEPSFTTGNNGAPGRYDFRIRACWDAVGLAVPQQTETNVRLYEL